MPSDMKQTYIKISPGSSNTSWITTGCDANGVALGPDFSKELTLGDSYVMDTMFGKCKVLVTESIGGGVKTRYEVLGENEVTKGYAPAVGTIITVVQAIHQFDSAVFEGHMEVNGCTLATKFVRVKNQGKHAQ